MILRTKPRSMSPRRQRQIDALGDFKKELVLENFKKKLAQTPQPETRTSPANKA